MMKRCIALGVAMVSLLCVACKKSDKLKVGSILFDANNEWFLEAISGMDAAAKDLGVQLVQADAHYDINVEKDLIREQIKNKADALVICPLTTEETGSALTEAKSFNIPVVTWNTIVTPPPTTQIIVDATQLGSATGEYLVDYVKKNNITDLKAALLINTSFSIGIERCNGFRTAIQPLIDSGVLEIVTERTGQLLEEVKVTTRKMLEERPDINFIWCWNQMTLVGAVDVLKELGRSDILVTGTDMSMALARDMLGDEVNLIAVTTQQPFKMGYDAIANAVRAAKGEKTQPSVAINTLTYTKDDTEALNEYITEHAPYVK